MIRPYGPRRIVCLTPEPVDVLYRLGEAGRIAGISGFTVHPPEARREKPKVSAFTTARMDRIVELEPDLVLGFSDLQADLAAELVRAGIAVHVFNQRSVAGILDMVRTVAALVGCPSAGRRLVDELVDWVEAVGDRAAARPDRPRVYFEEWDDPPICGIRWVSELIAIAGGEDVFADRAEAPDAKRRILDDTDEVIRRDPELIIGSWCGKRFRPERVAARPGWQRIAAVRRQRLHEIKSADILQPGPMAIERGLMQLEHLIALRFDPPSRGA